MAESDHSVLSDDPQILTETTTEKVKSPVDEVLKKINETFQQSKADQILRLLTDQDTLNSRFKDCDLKSTAEEDKSDTDSLSESSVKETETRLSQRLQVHKQQGGRSKTSLGFHNDVDKFSSDDEDKNNTNNCDKNNKTMADEDRPVINTRINRPKSSYVRRRAHHDDSDDDLDVEFSVRPERRAMSGRPKSRLGNRGGDRDVERRMVLRETDLNTYNPPPPPSPVRQETQEVVDISNYDKFASTRTPLHRPSYQRQRSNARAFCENPAPENSIDSSTVSGSTVVSRSVDTPLYHKPPTNPRKSVDVQEQVQNVSPVRRHRRQQLRSARANRPTSENVFMVRQRTEARLLKNNASAARPKSEKVLLQASSGKKQMLSIDTNPLQASQSNGFQPPPSNFQPQAQQDYKHYGNQHQRPVSRRGNARPEVTIPARAPNNVGVLGHGRQPIGLMKLPPLDPSVSNRADRIVLQPAREACV